MAIRGVDLKFRWVDLVSQIAPRCMLRKLRSHASANYQGTHHLALDPSEFQIDPSDCHFPMGRGLGAPLACLFWLTWVTIARLDHLINEFSIIHFCQGWKMKNKKELFQREIQIRSDENKSYTALICHFII